jgi:hypothetical protein
MGKGDGKKETYSHPGWYEITLVEHKDEMLVWSLGFQVALNIATTGALGISGIQNVNDNIRGVNDLVELVPDTFGLPFAKDWVFGLFKNTVSGRVRQAGPILVLLVRLQHRVNDSSHIIQTSSLELWLFAL